MTETKQYYKPLYIDVTETKRYYNWLKQSNSIIHFSICKCDNSIQEILLGHFSILEKEKLFKKWDYWHSLKTVWKRCKQEFIWSGYYIVSLNV